MRPPKPLKPRPGQESVWDYPRPPRLEPTSKELVITLAGEVIAHTTRGYRVLETSHPPVYYFPPADLNRSILHPNARSSWCEWKGPAHYYDIVIGNTKLPSVAWYYADPRAPFEAIANHVAFYPQPMDGCFVNGERVRPQPGRFYGGWITDDILGPFKGVPGSDAW